MNEEKIAENLVYPLWRCVDKEFKSKYRADAWNMFENFLKSASFCENLKSFLDKFKRLAPIDWEFVDYKPVLATIASGEDEAILLALRTECAYLVLLTRAINEAKRAEFEAAKQAV